MLITEEDIKYMVSECINRILSEHVDVIYQLDTAISLIDKQWESPDDFWYVYISQRKKDNLQNFHKNHNSDGSKNFGVNYIAYGVVSGKTKQEAIECLKHIQMNINGTYQSMISNSGRIVKTIDSPRELSAVIYLCNKFNARCYMTINKRSMNQTNSYADTLKKRGLERGREFQFAAGQQKVNDDGVIKWSEVRPWGLIDCDIDNPQAQAELESYLDKNNIKPEKKYESHDGMHYLFSNRDAQKIDFSYFDRKYRPQNAPRRKSDPMVLFKGDACMLLYSVKY